MTDADWAKWIAWLKKNRLVIHIPLKGPVWFERKRTE